VPTDKRQRQRENASARAAALRAAQQRRAARSRVIAAAVAVAAVVAVIAFLIYNSTKTTKKTTVVASPTTAAGAASPTTAVSPTTAQGPTATTAVPTTVAGVGATAPSGSTTPCPKADGTSPRTESFAAPPQRCIDPSKTYTATMTTDAGAMTIALDARAAPLTVNNFVFLARYHFYDGLGFHRVIPGFVDQGGDPKGDGSGGPGYQFADELPHAGAYKVGSLAMANSGANTNGSQFFIIVGAQGSQLPPQYSLFGMVTTGVDVAHRIEADGSAPDGTPKVPHKITTVTITES